VRPADTDGPLRKPSLKRSLFGGYSKKDTQRLLDLASHMIEDLTGEVTRQQSDLAKADAQLHAVLAELDQTKHRLKSTLTDLEQAKAERQEEDADRVVGDALVTAHRAASQIVAEARTKAESILESARESAETIQSEANYVIEQAEIRAVCIREQAAADIERLQAQSVQLQATVARQRQLWGTFLRQALAALDGGSPRSDQEPHDLQADLRDGIRPSEPEEIGPPT
jgi:cell division septum initiation protein DivIVA